MTQFVTSTGKIGNGPCSRCRFLKELEVFMIKSVHQMLGYNEHLGITRFTHAQNSRLDKLKKEIEDTKSRECKCVKPESQPTLADDHVVTCPGDVMITDRGNNSGPGRI